MGEYRPKDQKFDVADLRLAVIVARWNSQVTEGLLQGVVRVCERQGAAPECLNIFRVPGAFELALASQQAARSGRFDAVIALGCVIRGDTPHFDYVCAETTRGISQVALDESLPVAFGVLTTDTLQQAIERSIDNAENKGEEATLAVLETLETLKSIWNVT